MDINNISAQIKALAAQTSGLGAVSQTAVTESAFSKTLNQAISQVNELQNDSTSLKTSFELGDPSVKLHDVMISSQKAKIAFTALTEVRNKFISAYQEIMNLQV